MTTSKTYIEEMQARLVEVAKREQALVRALDDALANADRQLLDDVRSVTLEHEARRSLILSELQTLAERIGTFPAADLPPPRIEYVDAPPRPAAKAKRAGGGDWREAAENIPDVLDLKLTPTGTDG